MRHSQKILTAIAVALALLWSSTAFSYNVSPMIIEVDAEPGRSYTGGIEINNREGLPESVNVYVADWDKLPNGDERTFAPGSLARSCGGWLSFDKTRFQALPNDATTLKYSFTVPENATGTYWTFIVIEGDGKPVKPDASADQKQQMLVQARLSYAIRLFVTVKSGEIVRGEIAGVDVGGANAAGNAPPAAGIVFRNSGNILLKPRGTFEIRNADGATVSRTDIPPKYYILPGHDRKISIPMDKLLSPGEYVALAVFDYGAENLVAGEARFSVGAEDGGKAQ